MALKRRRRQPQVSTNGVGQRTENTPNSGKQLDVGAELSTGSTLLNLACSGNPHAALIPGRYYMFVGDSSSGKTVLMTSLLAEACRNPFFDDYELVNDDVEYGNNILKSGLFGERVQKRVVPPRGTIDNPECSFYIEDFYDNIQRRIAKGRPFIYILDSMDCLTSQHEEKKARAQSAAREDGESAAGKMTDGKAKINSQNLRPCVRAIGKTGSILVIVCQTRDNLGMGQAKTRSGGRALRFYNTCEIWTSRIGTLSKTVQRKKRQIGIQVEAHVKKNRLRGWEPKIKFPIFHSYGVDDLGSCFDYLAAEGVFTKPNPKGSVYRIPGLMGDVVEMTKDAALRWVEEDDGRERRLRTMCGKVWHTIIEKSRVVRKPRYE